MRNVICPLLLAVALSAQTTAFDAASIKPNASGGGVSSMRFSAGRVTMENVSLKKLMLNAYGIPDDREYAIAGPDWLTSEHFDIVATFPADTPTAKVREMLQTLLADRFKLTLHKETRELPDYRLVVAKDGPKIHAVEAGSSQTTGGRGRFAATRITMPKLADLISREAGRPVVDATGLEGVFSFTLEWSPESALRLESADAGAPAAAEAGQTGPSVFTALQEQLGLRLESGKGPVEVLVVDSMQKSPTEN